MQQASIRWENFKVYIYTFPFFLIPSGSNVFSCLTGHKFKSNLFINTVLNANYEGEFIRITWEAFTPAKPQPYHRLGTSGALAC